MVSDIFCKHIDNIGFWGFIILITLIFYFFVYALVISKKDSELKFFFGLMKITTRSDIKMIFHVGINIAIYLIILAAFIFIHFNGPRCTYQISSDEGTMRRLIEAESDAVNKGDISIIKDIFSSDAIIEDKESNTKWTDPISHYEKLFSELVYTSSINYSIKLIKMAEDEIIFTSSSQGRYTSKINPSNKEQYNNPPGSNEWVFKKNSDGCWKIIRFTFNIKQ